MRRMSGGSNGSGCDIGCRSGPIGDTVPATNRIFASLGVFISLSKGVIRYSLLVARDHSPVIRSHLKCPFALSPSTSSDELGAVHASTLFPATCSERSRSSFDSMVPLTLRTNGMNGGVEGLSTNGPESKGERQA